MPTISSLKVTIAFPYAEIAAALGAELRQEATRVLKNEGKPVPTDAAALSAIPTVLDSLAVVEMLMTIEPILDCELPDRLVKTGGYTSVEEALDHLLPRVEEHWKKKSGK